MPPILTDALEAPTITTFADLLRDRLARHQDAGHVIIDIKYAAYATIPTRVVQVAAYSALILYRQATARDAD